MAWASGGVTAAVVVVAVVLSTGGAARPSGQQVLLGGDPTPAVTASDKPSPNPSPTAVATPSATAVAAPAAHVILSFPVGTADGLYGIEHVGDTGTSGFHVIRIDPDTLAVQRSALIPGTEGGLAVDNQAVYVTTVDGTSVLRFAPTDLAPLSSWRDPLARLTGPVVTTRFGLWVADAHGLTRLIGDGQAPAALAERSPGRIMLAAGYSTPDLLAGDFWAVVLDDKDCPTLYHATGPDGLGGNQTPVHQPDCALGFAAVVATPGGVMISTPTGMLGYVSVLTPGVGGWSVARGPQGPNSIAPWVAGKALFVAVPGELMCLDPGSARTLATTAVQSDQEPQVVRAGGRDLLVFGTGQTGAADGPRVEHFTPDPACG